MYEYEVTGMTCGSCANSIQKVIKKIDPEVTVHVDLEQQLVHVQSVNGKDQIASLIEKAGYQVLKPYPLKKSAEPLLRESKWLSWFLLDIDKS